MSSVLETFYTLFESKTDGVKKGADEAKKHVDDVEKHVKEVDKQVKQIEQSFMNVAKAVAEVGTAWLSYNFFKNGLVDAVNYNSELDKNSKLMNINANDLAAWDNAARASGAQSGELTSFLHGLYIEYAKLGRADLIPGILDKFREWNRIANTMSKDDSFRMFSQMQVPENLIRFLQMAPDKFDELIKKQHELNAVSKEDTENARQLEIEIGNVGVAWRGLFTALTPQMTTALRFLEDVLKDWTAYFRGDDKNAFNYAPKSEDKATGSGTRGIRNNNPGNLKFAGQGGAWNADGFAAFASSTEGLSAERNQLMRYGGRGLNTIADIIRTWAPNSENDTAAYIADMVKTTGFSANQRLNMNDPAVIDALMHGINKHENGFDPFPAYAMASAQKQLHIAETVPLSSLAPLASSSKGDTVITTGPITINTQATDANGIAISFADNLKTHVRSATGNWNDGVER